MTFEDIRKANESIRTTNIKGKEYAEVNQRIKAFRMVYPTGAIVTELLKDIDGECTFKATVLNEEGIVIGTGHAKEKEESSFINKTSYIENCETSAIGRALGMCGFGIDTSVASYEEVSNAILNQENDNTKPTTPKTCEVCGKSIVGVKTAKGEFKTPDDMIQYSKGKYGQRLCWDCIKKRLADEQ